MGLPNTARGQPCHLRRNIVTLALPTSSEGRFFQDAASLIGGEESWPEVLLIQGLGESDVEDFESSVLRVLRTPLRVRPC